MPARVLIVDDESDYLDALTKRMRMRGITVFKATSAQDALLHTQRYSFDLALVDLFMPKLDGLRLIEAIREQCPEQQVVLVTGYPTRDAYTRAMGLGATAFLAKPVDIEVLLEFIREARKQRCFSEA